ncbi:MAG: hypothetical protein EWV50_11730 [Microcystis aeruginosa Ma_MB_F_20061100_S20]|uniref:Uncharacterized protein n=1 Tax=Microcystis aeruginosa Ma_MB_F_20061100_S20D TaxID=2486253 RepID=A0A552EFZ5_MICAE|nr:MAG: hypothetical protein EWV78_15435 [Microcystis aeruginosa Ma_MB_F_20061100_S20D]TRU38503.1 MAG: hypothetical protein EWV50_11730 [Microcystis aeruginosa Ma_MB_F_20061100_S20]
MTHIMTDIRTADKSARIAFPPRVETTGLPSSRLFSCGVWGSGEVGKWGSGEIFFSKKAAPSLSLNTTD